jgi:protoporphyrinogen oxidase
VVDGALGLHEAEVGYNASFRYPRTGGIRILPDAVARSVNGLELSCEVLAVHLKERWLETRDGRRLEWRNLVATASLPHFLDMVRDDLPAEVRAARAALRWVRVLNVALGVSGEAPTAEHWLYFPEPHLPFYRVGFPSNHGVVAPSGEHTVSIEVSLDPGAGSPSVEAERAEQALAGIGYLDRAAVRERRITVLDPSYVVFDHARRTAVATLRRFCAACGVVLAGRWAEWKYSAMEDAILDGFSVARRLCGR